jgi:Flp pilus assembly pilin Flp
MESMSTALRAFFTRRLDPTTVSTYALLIALVAAVAVIGSMIVSDQLSGL